MSTKYGTIPTSTAPSTSTSNPGFISRAKERSRSALATSRPWRELVHRRAFTLPDSLSDAYLRVRTNAAYFSANYAIIVLLVVFVSLLWHPISLIVFLLVLVIWLFLYFLRDEPIEIFHLVIGDKIVLLALSVLTLVLLLLTHATLEILVSLLVGVVVVAVHAAVRRMDDLFLEEEGAGGPGGWYAAVPTTS